jgi:hypothetical protein
MATELSRHSRNGEATVYRFTESPTIEWRPTSVFQSRLYPSALFSRCQWNLGVNDLKTIQTTHTECDDAVRQMPGYRRYP